MGFGLLIDPPMECRACEGSTTVEVAAWTDVSGTSHIFYIEEKGVPEIPCPRCKGTGDAPERDEFDDPRIP